MANANDENMTDRVASVALLLGVLDMGVDYMATIQAAQNTGYNNPSAQWDCRVRQINSINGALGDLGVTESELDAAIDYLIDRGIYTMNGPSRIRERFPMMTDEKIGVFLTQGKFSDD